MKVFLAALLLYFSAGAKQRLMEGFKVKKAGFSRELELIAGQLAADEDLSFELAKQAASSARLVNNDLQKVPVPNALFLVKSEIYKGLLNNPLLPRNEEVFLSESLLKSVEKKLEKNKLIYSDFAEWTIRSVLSELEPYRQNKFLDRRQTLAGNDPEQRAKALQLEKTASYLTPWIRAFNENSPEQFNRLASEVAAALLKRLASKTYYFKNFAPEAAQTSKEELGEVFSVPTISRPNETQAPLPPADVKKESAQAKEEGKKVLQKLEKQDLENPSPAIDRLLEKEEKNWTPK